MHMEFLIEILEEMIYIFDTIQNILVNHIPKFFKNNISLNYNIITSQTSTVKISLEIINLSKSKALAP
jgi:hypothetical protein